MLVLVTITANSFMGVVDMIRDATSVPAREVALGSGMSLVGRPVGIISFLACSLPYLRVVPFRPGLEQPHHLQPCYR